jgi:hypothetical protein
MSTTEVKAVSTAAWKKAKVHNIMLPSGVRVDIVIPDLARLIETGQVPQNLLDAALGLAGQHNDQKPTVELIKQEREFTDMLVKLSVVNPKLSDEDLDDLPYEDKEKIVKIANRQHDLDAEGEPIAEGLAKSDKYRKFRGIFDSPEDVEGL